MAQRLYEVKHELEKLRRGLIELKMRVFYNKSSRSSSVQ